MDAETKGLVERLRDFARHDFGAALLNEAAATIARLTAECDEARARAERAEHVARDLVQHIDWLTSGLPDLLERGGLTDEEGLIGAAIDAAKSARAALTQGATDGRG